MKLSNFVFKELLYVELLIFVNLYVGQFTNYILSGYNPEILYGIVISPPFYIIFIFLPLFLVICTVKIILTHFRRENIVSSETIVFFENWKYKTALFLLFFICGLFQFNFGVEIFLSIPYLLFKA